MMIKKILLIDDDIDELYILNEALAECRLSFECIYAETVADGIETMKQAIPDFVFLDVNLPGINGFEGLTLMKRLKTIQAIPVILYSTGIDETRKEKAMLLGAAGAIRKTGSIKTLSEKLQIIFEESTSLHDR